MKAICYTYTDPTGAQLGALVAVFRPDYKQWDRDNETEDQFVWRMFERHQKAAPDARGFELVDESALPVYDAFRNAWEQNGTSVRVNAAKRSEIAARRPR